MDSGLSDKTRTTLAIDLGATNLRAGLVRLAPNGQTAIIDQVRGQTVANDGKALLNQVIGYAKAAVAQHPEVPFDTIGVSACGIISDDRIAKVLPNLHVRDLPLADELEKAFPFAKARVANDANASALSEALLGAARPYQDSVFVTISSGIGTGYVYRKQLINTTMEGGRIVYAFEGKLVETEEYLSGNGIARLCAYNGLGKLSGREFFDKMRAHDPDPKVRKTYNDWIKNLGCFFGNLQRMFDVDVYVLSGGVMKSQDVFLPDLLKVANAFLAPYPLKPIVFVEARFGQDAGLMGGAAMGFSLEK